ncbi:hypothetical protein MNB_SM-3-588 [hydrothermal vent metagenome]|uniref:Uncharacterized protein n=1 Tax=hydrothermal vent metagenome TaxID=652676 RepID=A0A1W1D2N2_9ZZZZ
MRYFVLIFFFYVLLFGAPAMSTKRVFKNADGTTFVARAMGDSYLHWIQTDDGEILKYNKKTKNFEYATIKNNALVASGIEYSVHNSKRARALGRINKVFLSDIKRLRALKREKKMERYQY